MTTKKATKKSPKSPLRQRDNNLKTQSGKQAAQIIVESLIASPNKRGAIAAAGRKAYPNQSMKSARISASRLLKHPDVQAMLERRRQRALEASTITREEVIGLLAQQARASLGDVLGPTGELDMERARANGLDHLLKQVEVTERHHTKRTKVAKNRYATSTHRRTTTKYKIHDPQKAMDLLAEIAGWKKQAMKNPIDSARESFAILRQKPEYRDLDDATLAQLAQESHGLPATTIPDIMAGVPKG